MYLKSIEIQGFKSFANKIVFDFHNGITGIVGPNGSGKSNVADAVRWVLGEQRIKQLRGASMQDVIFSGTETRKPQGFAYVAITLDNSDGQLPISFHEVTVSRRVYRSGESEYMINGGACRLKDISELFYDTGIGKEGYSIIGQGQIDKILSGKPEERRELFDEAAGIVKFKRRKTAAQKKLEDEKQNLVRVSDILNELEKQIAPLEKQAEAAKIYLRLKEELKIYDANMFLLESEAIKELLGTTKQNFQIVEDDRKEATLLGDTLKVDYKNLEHILGQLEVEIEEKKQSFYDQSIFKGNLEGQINVLHEQIHTEQMNEEHIDRRMTTLTNEMEGKDEEKVRYLEEKTTLEEELQKTSVHKEETQTFLDQADEQIKLFELQTEHAKGDIIDSLNEKASLNAKRQRYETMLEQAMVRRSEVYQKILKFKSDEAVQDEAVQRYQNQLVEVEDNIKHLQSDLILQEKTVEEKEQNRRQLAVLVNEKQQEYHMTLTKLDSLKNIAERYDGYGNSIRKVMEVRDRIHGIHGVVADIITTEKKYEIAIETALGGSIQNIVTDGDQTAKQLIEYLKKNKFGRATFIPLTNIGNKDTFHHIKALEEPGVLGLANKLAQVDPDYEGLSNYLLGRVVVVDHIDRALPLARKYQYALRIVTLDGELLSAGGSMTGGAFKNTSNLLGRKREIEELEDVCGNIQRQGSNLSQLLEKEEINLISIKKSLEIEKTKLQEKFLIQNTAQMNLEQMEERKMELAEDYRDLEHENRLLEQQVIDIHANKKELTMVATTLDQKQENFNSMIDQMSDLLETKKSAREQIAKDLSNYQLELSNLSQKKEFISENIKRIFLESNKLQEELGILQNGVKDSKGIIEGKHNKIQELKGKVDKSETDKLELEGQLAKLNLKKEGMVIEQKTFFTKREEVTVRIGALDKELFRLGGQIEKFQERLDGQIDYMWSEYEITLIRAEKLKDEELNDLNKLKKQITELKNQVKSIGNINVNAIEDFKELSERYIFLKTQHDDLVEAEKALLLIIDELDLGMRKQFEEKFREIKAEFDKVFRELFGGGRGTLELMEDEDILEAGVQIISQPPGKKLQNMMQLSGGEKALTAIALLFAIQNLKPSPFCLLDEIEAALDDSNVGRFAGYLHKLTANTQFIIITHRRGTMVASDRLYGITMQEKGVSTLVSVNLIENELDS